MIEEHPPSEIEALDALRLQFNDSSLKSSTRVLILISLALNRKMSFVSLMGLTGMGKGSLTNHLEKLESSSYIITKNKATFSGNRTVVEITEKGLDAYNSLLQTLNTFKKKE